jgi:hypothetical protein
MTPHTTYKSIIEYSLLWVLISVFSRVIPHPYSASAIISLSLWSPIFFNRYYGLVLSLLSMFIADICLHFSMHYPLIGSWSVFTYSAITLLVLCNRSRGKHMLLITAFGALGFWLWTNFGTWLMTSDMYPKTFMGLINCFIAGLPFLKNSLIASLLYSAAINLLYRYNNRMSVTKI